MASCFVGLPKRYLTDVDLSHRTTTGDPEGEPLEAHDVPAAESLDAALADLRGEIELPIPTASAVKIGGERAYKLHRQGVAVEMPLRRSQVDALDVIAYTAGIATLDLRVSSGTYIRSIADALGGHCVSLRRTEVGPFSVEEADAERVLSLDEALGRIGMTVAEAEAERRRKAQSDRQAHEERTAREAELEQRQAHRTETDATVTRAEETDAEAGAAACGQAAAEEKGAVGG
jgi:tRNA pseudouridine(55) synthase